jgi:hypothetical protein
MTNQQHTSIHPEVQRERDRGPPTYACVCSGISAPTLAAKPLGWKTKFFSEIEPFPRAVCSCNYPDNSYRSVHVFTTHEAEMVRKKWVRGKKHCACCDSWKSPAHFHKNTLKWDGYHAFCKSCMSAASKRRYNRPGKKEQLLEKAKRYRKANVRKRKDTLLKSRFGISLEIYEQILQNQDGRCAICKRNDRRLCVDHCHTSLKVRGLLCTPCNTSLGAFGNDLEVLSAAIKYLEAA